MKITDFKEGDLICRTAKTEKYVADSDYIGACFMFSEIVDGIISLMMLFYPPNKNENGEIYELELSKYDDNFWSLCKSTKLRRPEIIDGVHVKLSRLKEVGDENSIILYESILNTLKNAK